MISARNKFIAAILVMAVVFLAYWFSGVSIRDAVAPSSISVDQNTNADPTRSADIMQSATKNADSLLSSSLRGTAEDGEARFDADGRLLLDSGLRRLFDYYLSLIGEREATQIRDSLQQSLLARLSAAQVDQIMRSYDRYVAFLQSAQQSDISGITDPQKKLLALKQLRREKLGGEMAEGFFAEEEALAELTLQRMAIANDAALNAEQKAQALAALDAGHQYTQRGSAEISDLVALQNQQLLNANASEQERFAEREAQWGKEAAQRLAQLDDERDTWNRRLDEYQQARARIESDSRLNAQARSQAVAQLRSRMFNETEQRRIISLESVNQLDAARY
jgi:lipase chaperone LimK